ncbi:tryptophan--tRNA ligase [bacterium]|nr:tryptophan--tRNA ligase [bacterium]
MSQRIFSGIQPSGSVHIGNYAGALRNWVELQKNHQCIYCIVDYHAMTMPYDPAQMPQRVLDAALDILACGVDPERSLLFVQSHVPQHCELSWILGCTAPMGELNRMTQFKEKGERVDSVTVGLFTYPVLQSADILLYRAGAVPVGEDQLQHLELTREIARRFNARYGDTFPEPKPVLTPSPRVMDLSDPTRKMSKSVEGSTIMLSDSDEVILRLIKRAVTDVGPAGDEMSPGVKNLFTLLEATASPEVVAKFEADYASKSLRYGDLKAALSESMLATLRPIRERRAELAANPKRVLEILGDSARQCRKMADETLAEVRHKCGLGAGL